MEETAQTPLPPNRNRRNLLLIAGAIILIILLSAGAYFLGIRNEQQQKEPNEQVESNVSPTPEDVFCTQEVKECPDGSYVSRQGPNCEFAPCPTTTGGSSIPENWGTYTAAGNIFSFKYPPDMTLEKRADGLALIKIGPTQREGTEVYDGILLNFRTGSLQGQTLQQYVQGQVEESQQHAEVTRPLSQTTINGISGYTFMVRGLGEFTHIYLPLGDNQFLHISKLVEDPSNQGFEKTANQVLSTLTLQQ